MQWQYNFRRVARFPEEELNCNLNDNDYSKANLGVITILFLPKVSTLQYFSNVFKVIRQDLIRQ